jgi:hypothetical protein
MMTDLGVRHLWNITPSDAVEVQVDGDAGS